MEAFVQIDDSSIISQIRLLRNGTNAGIAEANILLDRMDERRLYTMVGETTVRDARSVEVTACQLIPRLFTFLPGDHSGVCRSQDIGGAE